MSKVPGIAAAFVFVITCAVQPVAAQTTYLDFAGYLPEGLSGNGRFVVHQNNVDVAWRYVSIYDRVTGQHERIDVSTAGVPGNNYSGCSSVSATGRFVVFLSSANNLVTDDSNFVTDVFVRDRQTGQTTRESFYANGAQLGSNGVLWCPSISDDGRYVVFNTQEPLVAIDTNGNSDAYVRDRTLGTTTIVSVSSTGQVGFPHGASSDPRISANGRFVTWVAYTSLVPGVSGWQVYVRDLQTSQTTVVSRSTAGVPGDYISQNPVISGDGRFVAFYSRASNLVADDTGGFADAFVHDRQTGETTRVSLSSGGVAANFHSGLDNLEVPSISYDGRYIAFVTRASNLVPSDTNNAEDTFVRDRVAGRTYRATLRNDQSEAPNCVLSGETGGKVFLSYSGMDMLLTTALPLVHFDTPPGQCQDGFRTYLRRVLPASAGGFDADSSADVTVFRPSNSTWYTRFPTTAGSAAWSWGSTGDIPTAADYDGDGRLDYAVFRPSTGVWYWMRSWTDNTTYGQYPWGMSGDVPAPGDYDGDGKADPAVFRPGTGTWFARLSGANFTTSLILQFGADGDVPVAADYDGDRKMDIAVYRPSTGVWYIRHSSTGAVVILQWGISTDVTVPGDYDGDERADVAVYRPSQGVWFIAKSTTNFATYDAIQWGVGADVPVPGDYNGDGRMDVAVFRPGSPATWWIYNQFAMFWGTAGDVPIGGRLN